MDDTRELAEKLFEYSKNSLYISYSEFCCEVHILAKAHLDLLAKWEALDEPTEEMIEAAIAVTDCDSEAIRHNLIQEFKAMIAKAKE